MSQSEERNPNDHLFQNGTMRDYFRETKTGTQLPRIVLLMAASSLSPKNRNINVGVRETTVYEL